MVEYVAQAFGLVGMTMNILSFQRKEQKNIIFMQMVGSIFFAVNYFMIGAFAGALLNIVGIIRATAYWQRERFRTDKLGWVFAFGAMYVAVYILSFVLFGTAGTPRNYAVELLPVVGMLITTVSYYLGEAKKVRILGLVNAPFWLTYNIINFAIGGIVTESVSLVSIIIAMCRYDFKKESGKNEKAES